MTWPPRNTISSRARGASDRHLAKSGRERQAERQRAPIALDVEFERTRRIQLDTHALPVDASLQHLTVGTTQAVVRTQSRTGSQRRGLYLLHRDQVPVKVRHESEGHDPEHVAGDQQRQVRHVRKGREDKAPADNGRSTSVRRHRFAPNGIDGVNCQFR